VLHGERTVGRFVLFPTKGKQWMIHRMDPVPGGFDPLPYRISPMLGVAGDLPENELEWAYEFKWDGIRALVGVDGGRPLALSRTGRDITPSFPELRQLGEELGATQVLLDGELVAFDEDGNPSFSRLQRRTHVTGPRYVKRVAGTDPVSYVIFDLLHLNGRPLLDQSYDDRRRELDRLHLGGAHWAEPTGRSPLHSPVRAERMSCGPPSYRVWRGSWPSGGQVSTGRAAAAGTGSRSSGIGRKKWWLEVGGWTASNGSRASAFGALILGVPDGDGSLKYVGKVGTGFSHEEIDRLLHRLRSLSRKTSPFGKTVPKAIAHGAHWGRPELVGEVRFSEWTAEDRLRHLVWRGLRDDKRPGEVIREP
jgi:bifunctional non-homologous end joining protein LigD